MQDDSFAMLIGFGRRRVISCYSRDIGSIYLQYIIIKFRMYGRGNGRPDGECVAPSVSIKDRSVVGCADQGLNCTNRMPGVGGSRNR